MMNTFSILRCMKCKAPVNDPDNPDRYKDKEMIMKARIEAGAWEGWLCKCGHYNGLDK